MTATIDLFRNATETQSFDAGDVVFAAGDPGDVMYVVQEGEVEVRVGDRLIDVAGPGSMLGELALLDRSPRSASAVARTACRLVPVTERQFLTLVQQTPFFALSVMRVMADRLRAALAR